MKRTVKKLGLVIFMASVMVGCGQGAKEGTNGKESEGKEQLPKITLGVMPSTDNIPFILAEENNFDEEHGVELEVQVFKSALDRDAAFQAGELDGIITDLVGVAIYEEADFDVKIVGAPHDQFDLVVKDEKIQSIKDLKGKEVVFSERTGTAYAVSKMLESEGMTRDDIVVKEIPQVPTRLELVLNDQVAAAILPEPFVTIGEAQGLRVLKSTKDLGINPFAIVFTTETVEKQAEAIVSVFDAYTQGATFIKENVRSAYIDLFICEVGFPETMKDEIIIPDYAPIEQVNVSDVESVFAWSKEQGLLTKELTPEQVMSDVYAKQ